MDNDPIVRREDGSIVDPALYNRQVQMILSQLSSRHGKLSEMVFAMDVAEDHELRELVDKAISFLSGESDE